MQKNSIYINRELSWLKFNLRVLEEAQTEDNPLLERLRFLSIFTSNLDEFFMVRVGGLYDKWQMDPSARDKKTGMTATEQLDAIYDKVGLMYPLLSKTFDNIMEKLAEYGVCQIDLNNCHQDLTTFAQHYFETEILPLLSPQIVKGKHPFPHLENKRMYIMVNFTHKEKNTYAVINIPTVLPKHVVFPGDGISFISTHRLIYHFIHLLFPSEELLGKALIRITRNADIEIEDTNEDVDFKNIMLSAIKARTRLEPVRMEVLDGSSEKIVDYLLHKTNLDFNKCFFVKQNFTYSFVDTLEAKLDPEIKRRLSFPPHIPKWPSTLAQSSIMEQVKKRDIFLSYPYHSTKPFIELLREASMDEEVVSIKITLYRMCAQSQVAEYLCNAAENGKEVTAIVELRARFDEANNINWSDQLYASGCNVTYGLEDMKIHSKIMLITKRTKDGLIYITHVATGNYNEKTSRIYADLNIITSNPDFGKDAVSFFKNITAENPWGTYEQLLVAPSTLKPGILDLIQQEIDKAEADKPAAIIMKMNSLTDKNIIDALISASQAGVPIKLIIRGICCLRPGVPGMTDNIEVISIVGRFLEHARVYIFGVGDDRKIYISSADMMTRNTEHRIEIAAPVLEPNIQQKILHLIELQLKDNVKARRLLSSGEYVYVTNDGEPLNSQEIMIKEAEEKPSQITEKNKVLRPKAKADGLLAKIKTFFHS